MAIVISGVNNNDKITAADGNIDLLSAVNYASPITVTDLTASNKISSKFIDVNTTIQLGVSGVATATTFVGNLTGNVNQTSNLLLQIAGSEKFRIASSGQLGIGGANYGTAGQVLTSGGSGSAATWSTINADAINEGNTKAEVIDSGSDGRFIVETEGSERLRITSAGNIGINTTVPSALLNVNTNASGVTDAVVISRDLYGMVGKLTNSTGALVVTSNKQLRLQADPSSQFTAAGSFIAFETDGTEKVRIRNDGNVGIGTDNPSAVLHLEKNGTSQELIRF